MAHIPLFISYDKDLDWLEAAPFGTVMDRQGHDRWRGVSADFGFFLNAPEGEPVGFKVIGFSQFDPLDPGVAEIFTGPRFCAPALGLTDASAGEVVLAAAPFLQGRSTIDREYFVAAMGAHGEDALACWLIALQAGNGMAHYGAGYTLLELGHPREAYRHLRHYTELVPADAWAWTYRARAAREIGELREAADCCRRALAAEAVNDEETDAAELLEELEGPA